MQAHKTHRKIHLVCDATSAPEELQFDLDGCYSMRGLIYGCIFGTIGCALIALIAWAVWKVVHHA